MGRTEIAEDVFLGIAAFLGAEDDDAMAAQPGKAAHDGAILGKEPVAVQLVEITEGLL